MENCLVHDPLEEFFDTMEEEFGDIFEDAMKKEVDCCDIVFHDAKGELDATSDESPEAGECKDNHDVDGFFLMQKTFVWSHQARLSISMLMHSGRQKE